MKAERHTSAGVSFATEVQLTHAWHSTSIVQLRWEVGGNERASQWQVNIKPSDFAALVIAMHQADANAFREACEQVG